MACANTTTSANLLALDHYPPPLLAAIVSECPNICRNVYGLGNTDLTGIGVVISSGVQIALAVLYWVGVFVAGTAVPAFYPAASGLKIVAWLRGNHQTCLWSQLVFSLTLSLAGLVRQSRPGGVYESSAIINSVATAFICLLLTMISFYESVVRWVLFTVGFLATVACALGAVVMPMRTAKMENVLQACRDYAAENNMPWRAAAVSPFHAGGLWEVFLSIGFVVLLSCMWLFLWQMGRSERALSGPRIPHNRRTKQLLIILMCLISLFMVWVAVDSFQGTLLERRGMDLVWDGQTGENAWGIGQIGALFTWVPLLIDLAWSGVHDIRQQLAGRAQEDAQPKDVSLEHLL
ncbi:MAG: hypothetical protein M1839_001280 [Geoglossum umbratile]|nr:MAG: hypothetical protein M1839_001280 [Geoglossum umbratile]